MAAEVRSSKWARDKICLPDMQGLARTGGGGDMDYALENTCRLPLNL